MEIDLRHGLPFYAEISGKVEWPILKASTFLNDAPEKRDLSLEQFKELLLVWQRYQRSYPVLNGKRSKSVDFKMLQPPGWLPKPQTKGAIGLGGPPGVCLCQKNDYFTRRILKTACRGFRPNRGYDNTRSIFFS